jgi:hypothetical protein
VISRRIPTSEADNLSFAPAARGLPFPSPPFPSLRRLSPLHLP